MYDEFDDLLPGKTKKHKKEDILSELDGIISCDYVNTEGSKTEEILPSSFLPKKSKKEEEEDDVTADEWLQTLMSLRVEKPKRRKGNPLFETDFIGKKKKKKNKDKNKGTDYKKEFEQELALYRNLIIEQSKFTENLQKEYDAISSRKSTARGTTKAMTDLVQNITSARTLNMQLVEKNAKLKEMIANLTAKERKELQASEGINGENLQDFASSYLKEIMMQRSAITGNQNGDIQIGEYTDDQVAEYLSEELSTEERSEDVEKYLKYENRKVQVYVLMNSVDTEDYEYVAKDENGEFIPDYPLPYKTNLSINRSTNIATDVYGKKYSIIWK